MNPKALNLESARQSQTKVTTGFKIEPKLKIKFAEKAEELGLTLSKYLGGLISEKEEIINLLGKEGQKKIADLSKRLALYENKNLITKKIEMETHNHQQDSQGEPSLTLLGITVKTPNVKWTIPMHNKMKKLFYKGWDDEMLAKLFGCTKGAIVSQRFELKLTVKEQQKRLLRKKNKDNKKSILINIPTETKQIPLKFDEPPVITVKKTSKSQIKMMAAFYCNPSVKQSILDKAIIPLNQYIVDLILRQNKEVYIVADEKNNFVVVNSKKEAAEYYQTFTDHRQIYQAFPMRQEDFSKNISASVSSDIAIKLEKLAEESGKSISDILNEALKNL
jgi:hypothetical protein